MSSGGAALPPLKPTVVVCPACRGDSLYASSNPYRPFCSERCKNLDLGAWASESFRMPAKGSGDDLVDDGPAGAQSQG
jgi:endogenous inhibitor of DNA gyrase (YacG/DUF329 family)